MADKRTDIRQVSYAYVHKSDTSGTWAPSNEPFYGPWESIDEAWSAILAKIGAKDEVEEPNDELAGRTTLPIGLTIGIKRSAVEIKEYWLLGGYKKINLMEKINASGGGGEEIPDIAEIRANAYTGANHARKDSVHVTTDEKTLWNGKQDKIDDLDTIRSQALRGSTHANNLGVHVSETEKTLWNNKQDRINTDTRLDVGTIVPRNILLSELSQIEFCDHTNLEDILTKLRCDSLDASSFPASDFTISYETVGQKIIPVIRIRNDKFVPMGDYCDLNNRVWKLQELVSPLRVKVYDSTWKQLLSNNNHFIENGYYIRGLVGTDQIAISDFYAGIEVNTFDFWSMASDYFERVDDNTYRYVGNDYIPWIKDANGDWLFVMSDTCYS